MTPARRPEEGISLTSALAEIRSDLAAAEQWRNYGSISAAKFRLAVATFDPAKVAKTSLDEFGIGLDASQGEGGSLILRIDRLAHYSFATISRALARTFRVATASDPEGGYGIKIYPFR